MAIRGYIVGQGYIGLAGMSRKERAKGVKISKKNKARAEFWKRYAESHPRITDPAVEVAKT